MVWFSNGWDYSFIVTKTNTFNARVIIINNMMVHTFINLKSTPLKYGCAPLKYGCTAPICWSEHFTCLFNKSYLKLLKNIFLLVGELGLPGFSGLGCTRFCCTAKLLSKSLLDARSEIRSDFPEHTWSEIWPKMMYLILFGR